MFFKRRKSKEVEKFIQPEFVEDRIKKHPILKEYTSKEPVPSHMHTHQRFIEELFFESIKIDLPFLTALTDLSKFDSTQNHPNSNINSILYLKEKGFHLLQKGVFDKTFKKYDLNAGTYNDLYSFIPATFGTTFTDLFQTRHTPVLPIFSMWYKLNISRYKFNNLESNIYVIGENINFQEDVKRHFDTNKEVLDFHKKNLNYMLVMYSEELDCFLIHPKLCYRTDSNGKNISISSEKDLSFDTFKESREEPISENMDIDLFDFTEIEKKIEKIKTLIKEE